jgi:hypothetical protein
VKYITFPILVLMILSLGVLSTNVLAQENQMTLTLTFQGSPVVNATVDVYLNGSIVVSATTDENGSCLIPSGAYTIFATLGNKSFAIIDYNTTTATELQVEITAVDVKINTTANIPVPVKITANNVKDLPITTNFMLYSNINVALTFPQEVMFELTRYTLKEIKVNNETMTSNSFTLTAR